MQAIVNLTFHEKMFRLQQTVTPCHTGRVSQAFLLFFPEVARSMNYTWQEHPHIYQNAESQTRPTS